MYLLTNFQFFSGIFVLLSYLLYSNTNTNVNLKNKLISRNFNNGNLNGNRNGYGNRNSYGNRNFQGIFQIPTNPPTLTIPELIPVRTSGEGPSSFIYRKLGTVYTEDPTEDSVYLLEGRLSPYNRNQWQYRVLTTSGTTIGNYSIPIYLNNGDPMKELYSGDTVTIRGKESLGNFVVQIDDPDPLFRF